MPRAIRPRRLSSPRPSNLFFGDDHVWRSVLAAGIVCAFGSGVIADQVTLKNGDRLTGTIVKSDDAKSLLIKTQFEGDVTVQWEAIASIESSAPLHLQLKDGRTIAGPVKTEHGKLEVATKEAGTISAPKEAVAAVRNDAEEAAYQKELHPRFVDFWGGLLDTGLSLTRGNSQTLTYTLSGKAARVTKRNKLSLYATAIYATDDTTLPGRTTANAKHGGIRNDFTLNGRFFVFAFTDFDSDEFQNLNLRNVIGGGFGYHVINNANTKFDVFGGGSFDQEYFAPLAPVPPATVGTPAQTRKTAEILVGETLSWTMNSRTTVTQAFSIYPNTSELGNYRFRFTTIAATKLKNWLSWQATFSDNYLSNPIDNLKKNDLLLSTGLRLSFGKGVF
ncbi:MAG: hypothetical protein C5B58_00535 [Acidobacteria bacterium]|nr:MAG: hypothetical protein C5B58_00535 [Acidobacteriota bacterium]